MKSRCPNCGEECETSGTNPYRPFCSERCKLIDLGDWLVGNKRIPGDEEVRQEDAENDPVRH